MVLIRSTLSSTAEPADDLVWAVIYPDSDDNGPLGCRLTGWNDRPKPPVAEPHRFENRCYPLIVEPQEGQVKWLQPASEGGYRVRLKETPEPGEKDDDAGHSSYTS